MRPDLKQKAERLIAEQRQIRDGLIAAAVVDRKIAPHDAATYTRMYDNNPKAVEHLLSAPVSQGGLLAGNAAAFNPLPPPVEAGYPAGWLPEVGNTRRGNVMVDGVTVDVTAQAPAPAAPAAQYPAEWLAAAPRLAGAIPAVPGRGGTITLEPGL